MKKFRSKKQISFLSFIFGFVLSMCMIKSVSVFAEDLYYPNECDPGLIHHTSVFIDIDSAGSEANSLKTALLGDQENPGLISRGQLADAQSLFIYFLKSDGSNAQIDYIFRTCMIGELARDIPRGLRQDAVTAEKKQIQDDFITQLVNIAPFSRPENQRTRRPNATIVELVSRLFREEQIRPNSIKKLIYIGILPQATEAQLRTYFPVSSLNLTEVSILSQNNLRTLTKDGEIGNWERAIAEAGGDLQSFNQPLSNPEIPSASQNNMHILKGNVGIYDQIRIRSALISWYIHNSGVRNTRRVDWLSYDMEGTTRSIPVFGDLSCTNARCEYKGTFGNIPPSLSDRFQQNDTILLTYTSNVGNGEISRERSGSLPQKRYETIFTVSGLE